MFEVTGIASDKDIEDLDALVKLAETTTLLTQYFNNQISRDEVLSKIYLENQEKSPNSKK